MSDSYTYKIFEPSGAPYASYDIIKAEKPTYFQLLAFVKRIEDGLMLVKLNFSYEGYLGFSSDNVLLLNEAGWELSGRKWGMNGN